MITSPTPRKTVINRCTPLFWIQQGNRIEVQIRTQEMHDYAELGVAAHWSYKEGGKQTAAMEKSVATLRKLLEEKQNDEALSDDFRSELFNDRVYVLTPCR